MIEINWNPLPHFAPFPINGFTMTPTWHMVSALVNAVIALGLGMYG